MGFIWDLMGIYMGFTVFGKTIYIVNTLGVGQNSY
jgi:hypothetical protein